MKLSDLVAKTRAVTIHYGDESVNLVVRTELMNTDFMVEMASLGKTTTDPDVSIAAIKSLPEILCRLVVSWDLEGDDGQPFPLVPAKIAEVVPVAFISACIQGAAQSVGESSAVQNGKISGATLSPVATSADSQTGTR